MTDKTDSNIITITVAPGFIRLFCAPKKVHEVICALGSGKLVTADSSKTFAIDDVITAGDYAFVPDDTGKIAEARRKMRAFPKDQWIHADVEFGLETLPVDLSLRFGELCEVIKGEFGIPADHRLVTDLKCPVLKPEMTLAECGVTQWSKFCVADTDEASAAATTSVAKEERVRVRFRGPGIKKSKISISPSAPISALLDKLRECKVLPAGINHRASMKGYELSMDDPVSEIKSSIIMISPSN